MAAYAALVSLEHIIHNLQHHSRPPISLHKEQVYLLTQKLTFLQKFLQVYNPNLNYDKEADPLESRIAVAAHAAEDAIESHIFYRHTNNDGENTSFDSLYEALEKIIEDMAVIEKEAAAIKETMEFKNQLHKKSRNLIDSSGSSSFSSSLIVQKKSMMVGADDLLLEMKDKLTSNRADLLTLPIIGMGGSGKTTLALNIFQDNLIQEHFDIRAWVTISQEYNISEILIQLLTVVIKEDFDKELSEGELGGMLHKRLYGERYMIVLDDMWSLKAWDRVKRFLPNNKKGSRVVITTRLITLASTLPNSDSLRMKLLDEDDSWDLLSKTVFGEACCPSEYEDIGKRVGKSCKGLPLSIVVVGGLLAKSEQSIEYWEHMEENLNAIVNLDDNERCLKTLFMSYKQLPVHLKPCFLYMGIYREDHVIRTSKLIRLWVAEGFLKSINGKRPEDVARAYLKDLIDRNLILVHELGSIGSIKECKVHDLLRDLCLREARKDGFYTICPGQDIEDDVDRIVVSDTIPEIEEVYSLSSATPRARSLILNQQNELPPQILRLMRVLGCSNERSGDFQLNVQQLVNLRFFNFILEGNEFPSFSCFFWNLHTLIVSHESYEGITVPADIWYMSHIRRIDIRFLNLPDSPTNVQDGIVLANLQSLMTLIDFTCSEQMVKTIPNIRKLRLLYGEVDDDTFCLTNLDCLDKLESLHCCFFRLKCRMNFPQALKKLSLDADDESHCWEDILDEIGALPFLQKFNFYGGSFKEGRWETSEGKFRSLKYLSLGDCEGLQVWTSEASHFPRLEQLHLCRLEVLEEIPSYFSEISTLRLIKVEDCSDGAGESAKRILEEQEAFYGEEETTLQVHVESNLTQKLANLISMLHDSGMTNI